MFSYFGHGSQEEERYMGEEVDRYEEMLVPLDFETQGMIVGNGVSATLVRLLPPGALLHAIIDACHNNIVLDFPYVYVFNPKLDNPLP